MNRSTLIGSSVAIAIALLVTFSSPNSASAQTRFRYGTTGQYNTNQFGSRTVYPSGTYRVVPNNQRMYVSPSNRITTYNRVTPTYRVQPGYSNSQRYYSNQPYQSGYRGTTTVYPNYNRTNQPYSQGQSYIPGYGYQTPGYYPDSSYRSGYRGYGYGNQSQQRGAAIGGAIGDAVGGSRGGNIGAAIGAAVGQ